MPLHKFILDKPYFVLCQPFGMQTAAIIMDMRKSKTKQKPFRFDRFLLVLLKIYSMMCVFSRYLRNS
uniref:Uncharacterized protein n=1 Tax=Octopus bimaculoides TaxID=37653 RepID=A0A0L8HMR3_OCTBM